jgi:hypothetical protein
MTLRLLLFTGIIILTLFSCSQKNEESSEFQYYDVKESETLIKDPLIAVKKEDGESWLQKVAYINLEGDTIIPFGHYYYYGTDTLIHFAYVVEISDDQHWYIAIDRNENILFDLVNVDNLQPDTFHEGLLRVRRDEKVGFANRFGQIVIPCIYLAAYNFENGQTEVTLKGTEYHDGERKGFKDTEWFKIDKKGNRIE